MEKAALDLGGRAQVDRIGPEQTLARMLAEGEIDALYSPRIPGPFTAGDPRVRRLFGDVVGAEKAYWAATGIFPIMHVVVVRRDVYEAHPWVAQSLTKALQLAKRDAEATLYDSSALRVMLPWLLQELEATKQLLGPDYWSYGLDANRPRARDVPALPPRAGAVLAPGHPGGDVRAGVAGVLRHLRRAGPGARRARLRPARPPAA